MNRAIVFVDGDNVKVVFGNAVKTTKVSDFCLPKNASFLDKLFENFSVFVVAGVQMTSREKLLANMSRGDPVSVPEGPQSELPSPPRRRPPVDVPTRPSATEIDILTGKVENGFLKSTAKTTLIIDDLPTGAMVAGTDSPQYVSVGPGRTINLGALDPERIRKSNILRGLMQRKTLVPVTSAEANRAETTYSDQLQKENDARLDWESPIIDGPAADYNGTESRIHDADPINLDEGADAPPEYASNEDSVSMNDLMAQMDVADQEGEIEIVELDGMGGMVRVDGEEEARARRREELNAARMASRKPASDPRGGGAVTRRVKE